MHYDCTFLKGFCFPFIQTWGVGALGRSCQEESEIQGQKLPACCVQ